VGRGMTSLSSGPVPGMTHSGGYAYDIAAWVAAHFPATRMGELTVYRLARTG
jgi:hypothetical protein